MQGNLSLQNPEVVGRDFDANARHAIDLMENSSNNVLITGRAGTGKSTLLEYFREVTAKSIVVLAPTGVAALNVKGQTIHSFFRFKPDITVDTVKILSAAQKMAYSKLDAIVIDEISMVRADLLDCVDSFLRANGKDARLPFGGIQMIFVGDLYQLPPVVTREEEGMFNGPYKSQYFFDSNAFGKISVERVELDRHYRQSEEYFISMLNAIRNNSITDEQLEVLNLRVDPSFVPDRSKMYITLTTTNRVADEINAAELSRLPGIERSYNAIVEGEFEMKVMPADELLKVKLGMQVMLLNNDKEERWVNGSIGEVVAINSGREGDTISVELDGGVVEVTQNAWDIFKFSYDPAKKKLVPKVSGRFIQYPIAPAWAVTIHKSQGKTFRNVIIDIGTGAFANGQIYVALSRCTTLRGIVLKKPIERRHILTDSRIIRFLNRIK